MIEQDNATRNIKADEWRIKFFSQKPTLRGIFSSREYHTLWSFLKPKRLLLLILTAMAFGVSLVEGSKALFLVGIIKGLLAPEAEIYEMLSFDLLGSRISPALLGISPDRVELLTLMFAGLLLMTILGASGKLLNTLIAKRVQLELMRNVRRKVLDKIFSLDIEYFDQARSGELLFLMNAETSRFSNMVILANTFLAKLIQSIFFFVILFYMSWDITLLAIAIGFIYFKLHIPLDMRAKQKSWEANLSQNTLSHFFHQIVYGIKMIKIGGCEERENKQYFESHREFEKRELNLTKLNALSTMFQEYVLVVVLLLTIIYISFFNDFSSLLVSPDNILAYLFLLSRTMPVAGELQGARTGLISSYGPLARVMELLHSDIKTDRYIPSSKTGAETISNIHDLNVRNLSFAYGSNGNVLEEVDLNFQKDKIHALVGFSGSGKSTLLDIISTVRQPVSGRIEVNSREIDSDTIQSFKRSIGYMNQEPIMFHDTIRNNVKYFRPDASEEEVWEALKLAAADEFIRELQEGLDTGLGERGLTVSGGQRQRIGLARVLLQNAPILLLDEATNALDYKTEETVYHNLKKLKDGRIIIVSAHRLSTLKDFDHIVVLYKGRVIEKGTHSSLMENTSFYYSLFRVQEEGQDDYFKNNN